MPGTPRPTFTFAQKSFTCEHLESKVVFAVLVFVVVVVIVVVSELVVVVL